MKRRNFMEKAALVPLVGTAAITQQKACSNSDQEKPAEENEYYELREYAIRWGGSQKKLESFFKDALIPALNRQGISKVGAFSELGKSTPVKLYVLIPHPSIESCASLSKNLAADTSFQSASKSFEAMSSKEVSYSRYQTWLLRAFDGLKKMIVKNTDQDRLFELRTYEGHNDDAVSRKEAMFDIEEIELFYKTQLNPVFFGKMIAGKNMPALTYMLRFKDMAERDANWDTFIQHPEWKAMVKKSEYADTVSNIVRVFLKPLPYSQI